MNKTLYFLLVFNHLLLICCIHPLSLNAQNLVTDSTATWGSFWLPEEDKTYTIDWVETKYQGSKIIAKDSLREFIRIRVLDQSETSYTLRWRSRNTPENLELSKEEWPDLVLLTDELGQFDKIANKKQLISTYEASLSQQLLDNLKQNELPQTQKPASAQEMFDSHRQKIFTYFFPYGTAYTKKGFQYDTPIKSPINNTKLPGYYNFQLIEANSKLNEARLRIEKRYQAGALKELLRQMIEHVREDPLSPEELAQHLERFQAYETYEYVIELATGWHKRLSYTKFYQLGDQKAILQISFQAID